MSAVVETMAVGPRHGDWRGRTTGVVISPNAGVLVGRGSCRRRVFADAGGFDLVVATHCWEGGRRTGGRAVRRMGVAYGQQMSSSHQSPLFAQARPGLDGGSGRLFDGVRSGSPLDPVQGEL